MHLGHESSTSIYIQTQASSHIGECKPTDVNTRVLLKGDTQNLLPWLSVKAPASTHGHLSLIPGTCTVGGENWPPHMFQVVPPTLDKHRKWKNKLMPLYWDAEIWAVSKRGQSPKFAGAVHYMCKLTGTKSRNAGRPSPPVFGQAFLLSPVHSPIKSG